jgi:hypothetical protein
MIESGYLIIADLSGYTHFLKGSELDHAQEIMEDLFAAILEHLEPPLFLSNIQGDAFFVYSPDNALLARSQIMDSLEALYFSFRTRLNLIVANTTCRCRACSNAVELDMKFIVHHGEYAAQEIANRRELASNHFTCSWRCFWLGLQGLLAKQLIKQPLDPPAPTVHITACIKSRADSPRQPARSGQGGIPKGDAAIAATKRATSSCQSSSVRPKEDFHDRKQSKA